MAAASADGVVTPPDKENADHPRKDSFEAWLKQVSPELTWDWKYQKYIYKHLQRVTDGTCKRLMIFMPPRHGKSELVTIRYAGWRLWNDPKMKIIVSSYNQKLADKFSRSIRKLLSEEEDRLVRSTERGVRRDTFPTHPTVSSGAPPIDVRKGCAFPETLNIDLGGSASRGPDARIKGSCDHPQCGGGTAADSSFQPAGKAEPFRTSSGTAADSDPLNAASQHSQIANRNSQITRMFPKTRTINTASQWETGLGGGVKAVGVGAGVTGFGGQLIIIDDPVKSRAEAESETYRERLWDWYRNDLYSRLEPDAAVVLIQTRWHQNDLAGRLLEEMQNGGDRWEVINLPALSERTADTLVRNEGRVGPNQPPVIGPYGNVMALSPGEPAIADEGVRVPTDPLGRPVGAALCPDRFDETKLADIQRQLGSYNFAALYQQHPTPAEGGIFKRAWFKQIVDKAPEGLQWKRGYDLAVSTRTTSCYTASIRVATDPATGNMYLADGFRKRIEYPDQKRYILERIAAEPDTEHGIEKALHGQAIIQDLRREAGTLGKSLRGVDVTADKVTRALKWAPLAEEGKLILVRGPWVTEFLDEIAQFPAGQFDDQIDAVSLAASMLQRMRKRGYSF